MTFTQTLWRLLVLSLMATMLSLGLVVLGCDSGGSSSNDDDTANDDDEDDTANDDDEDDTANDDDEDDTANDDDGECVPTLTSTSCPADIDPVGDISCVDSVPDAAPTGTTVTLTGLVQNFQTDAPVGGAEMEVEGSGITATSAPDGTYQLVGVPGNERININIKAAGYKETWQYQVFVDAADPTDNFVVVENSTYNLVQGLWGISPNPANCVIAGQISDCQGNELSGFGINALSCEDPDTKVKWFSNSFPSAAQCPASEDGLYGVVNIAPPDVVIQVVGADDEVLVEAGPVPCVPGAIGVFNLTVGQPLPE